MLLKKIVAKRQIDILLLQETWHPKNSLRLPNFQKPLIKERKKEEVGGGVAIVCHKKAKCAERKDYEVRGLEAIWAEVMVNSSKMIVGSVYIPPGKSEILNKFELVLTRILRENKKIIIGMDANSRNVIWDKSAIGKSQYSSSIKMGDKLLDIIETAPLYIHNDGSTTYHSGDRISAPDVTLSHGIVQHKTTSWANLDDDLGSPHNGLLLQIGGKRQFTERLVIDWENFPWDSYKEESFNVLDSLHKRWKANKTGCSTANEELTSALLKLTESLATKKRICNHSKPWINKDISLAYDELRKARKKMSHHRSQRNVSAYKNQLGKVIELIDSEYEIWWNELCDKLPTLEGKEKWRVINKLLNQTSDQTCVKPIRKEAGKCSYYFEDEEIMRELQNYHISKPEKDPHPKHKETAQSVERLLREAKKGKGTDIMNDDIRDKEVKSTFGKCSGASGCDKIGKDLIDKADRNAMHACLKYIYTEAWRKGEFLESWKMENRNVLAKPDKSDYHECSAYRTVAVTSVIGKRFEHISSQRLLAAINSDTFDENQFAYLKGRSATQAILVLVEKIKKALLEGQMAGALFIDLSDAFGSVDRQLLLKKIAEDFEISGRLLLHLNAFLTDRKARIILNGEPGEWIESIYGTSAGTILGSLLFIIYIHDTPKEARPKFADDITAARVADNLLSLQTLLQKDANAISQWIKEWGLDINLIKTKVMSFGQTPPLQIAIDGEQVKRTEQQRLLGVVLDKELNFTQHVDHAIRKARGSFGKMAYLLKGRKGIPVKEGIEMFKALIRPHMEYGIPAWASMQEIEIRRLEVMQSKCLRQLMGAKAHSTTDGMEVIANVPPLRLRLWDLCMREFIRIQAKDENHHLKKMMSTSLRKGQKLSPCAYLEQESRDWSSITVDLQLQPDITSPSKTLLNAANIIKFQLFQPGTIGSTKNRSKQQQSIGKQKVEAFLQSHLGKDVIIFTDGSVANGPYGAGACAIHLIPLEPNELNPTTRASPVGNYVENVECELQGIISALHHAKEYFESPSLDRKPHEQVYILCDCESAIDIVVNRNETRYHQDKFVDLDDTFKALSRMNVSVKVGWIPGHAEIQQNEIVDHEAKTLASSIAHGTKQADTVLSIPAAIKVAKDLVTSTWQRRWNICEKGTTTKIFMPKIMHKTYFPEDRSTGISYVRLLLDDTNLNADQHRIKIVDSAACDCGEDMETNYHFVMECVLYAPERNTMISNIHQIWEDSRSAGTLSTTMEVLLGSCHGFSLEKKVIIGIKDELFNFLRSTGKLL